MKTIFKNLGKAAAMMGCTVLQLIAMVLRFVSLIFEGIGWVFRTLSELLMNISTNILKHLGFGKTEVKEETT